MHTTYLPPLFVGKSPEAGRCRRVGVPLGLGNRLVVAVDTFLRVGGCLLVDNRFSLPFCNYKETIHKQNPHTVLNPYIIIYSESNSFISDIDIVLLSE